MTKTTDEASFEEMIYMGIAKFTVIDPSSQSLMIEDLYNLLDEIDGVLEWVVIEDSEVIVEYDHNRINEQVIEQVLSNIGLRLRYIYNDPNTPDFKAHKSYLSRTGLLREDRKNSVEEVYK